MKWNLFISIGLALFFLQGITAKALAINPTVLILNQVRGEECCEQGSLPIVREQVKKLESLGLPAAFLLRYDAITNAYFQLFSDKSQLEPGVFLEITPKLAEDSGVKYKGPESRWYKAENSYLLGYSAPDRFKIIATVMNRFKQVFGSFPKTTAGWMIDSQSLQLLVEKYGITTHEITRDQWGTDSYTLYGGPVGPSYIPSRNWPLIPAASSKNALPVTIVRQTISDPVWNYGDASSFFTSQPNDYMKANKNISYFEKLLIQSLAQKPAGIAVIGLESSMPKRFQLEFFKQLELVSKIRNTGEIDVSLPSPWSIQRLELGNEISLNQGSDKNITAVWVNAPSYRLRLLFNFETNRVVIDDVRIYDDKFVDPYSQSRPVTPNAYWTVPFIADASRFSQRKPLSSVDKLIQFVNNKLNVVDPCLVETVLQYDACIDPEGIELPNLGAVNSLMINDDSIEYTDQSDAAVRLDFGKFDFSLTGDNIHEIAFTSTHATIQALNKSKLFGLIPSWRSDKMLFAPSVSGSTTLLNIQQAFPDAFTPEIAGGQASLSNSVVVSSKAVTQLGRNPIRIVVYLRDAHGSVASPGTSPQLKLLEDPELDVTVEHPETSMGEYYLDVMPSHSGWFTPVVTLGLEERRMSPILIVPSCIKSLECFRKPIYLFRWIEMLVRDRIAL